MTSNPWTTANIPHQSGAVAIVTGSSSGIGYETARVLANKGAETIIAVRNLDKGNAAAQKIKNQNPNVIVRVMKLDLASLASIERFATDFADGHSRLDRLINNAGVMIPPYSKTADGYELQFGTNHLGHFAVTARLMDLLERTPNARIVNVSSSAHRFGRIDFEDLNWEKRSYKPWRAYGDSKIANLYFTYELDRRLKASGSEVAVTASHPGWTATELQRHTSSTQFFNGFLAQDISMGALPTLRAAYDESAKGGEFYGPRGFMELRGYPVEVNSNTLSKDHTIAAQLWGVSEKLTGVRFDAGRASSHAPAASAPPLAIRPSISLT
jgi:NAD(P)-dependent dehydrogenase (short-subunit alcohol dehydrogenase family)